MRTHEFWRERDTGHVWAVELREGIVIGCFGPLAHAEVDDELLARFDYDRDDAEWVEAHRDEFDLHVPAAVR
ncbi:MAG TPA: hypothetical protein VFJ91_10770 [Gaiellaceae bacterium]|nr:hypothetical protein [Gaiellaceae bacterium]